MTVDTWVLIGAVCAAIVGVVAVWTKLVIPAYRCVARLDEFLDDWFGKDAEPGHPRKPGVSERLEVLEGRSQNTDLRLKEIEAHLNISGDDKR